MRPKRSSHYPSVFCDCDCVSPDHADSPPDHVFALSPGVRYRMPPRRAKARAAAAAATAAAAAEERLASSVRSRFWAAQEGKVGADAQERVDYLLAATQKILDRVDYRAYGTGLGLALESTPLSVGAFLSAESRIRLTTAARGLAGEPADPNDPHIFFDGFRRHDVMVVMHLFAAVIGMLAPRLRVRIIDSVGQHTQIAEWLNSTQYLTLHKTAAGVFDVLVDCTSGSGPLVDRCARAVERHGALLIYYYDYIVSEAPYSSGSWVYDLTRLRCRPRTLHSRSVWLEKVFPRFKGQGGSIAVVAELIRQLPLNHLNEWLGKGNVSNMIAMRTRSFVADTNVNEETMFADAVIARLGEDSNGVQLWPAMKRMPVLYAVPLWNVGGPAQADYPTWRAYDEIDQHYTADYYLINRYVAFAKAHRRCVAFQQRRATVVREAVCPPVGGVVLIARALIPLVTGFLDHDIIPIPPQYMPNRQSAAQRKQHAGVKRKAPSATVEPVPARPAAAAAAAEVVPPSSGRRVGYLTWETAQWLAGVERDATSATAASVPARPAAAAAAAAAVVDRP